jgi:hypothetical protein
MSENVVMDAWLEAQEYQVPLNSQGKIIDFLEPDHLRENTPEERIRQKTGQFLHYELGYPKEIIAFERTINIGRDRPRVDIVEGFDFMRLRLRPQSLPKSFSVDMRIKCLT